MTKTNATPTPPEPEHVEEIDVTEIISRIEQLEAGLAEIRGFQAGSKAGLDTLTAAVTELREFAEELGSD